MKQNSQALLKGNMLLIIMLLLCSRLIGVTLTGAPARISMNNHVKAVYSNTGMPENAIDGNLTTFCQGDGSNSWLILALDDTITLDNIAIAYALGTTRIYYLSIQVSLDSTNWTTVLTDSTRGNTCQLETFLFEKSQAKYIRINGYNSNKSIYNLWAEVYLPPLNSTIISHVQHHTPFKILFIGNSYTEYGPIPNIMQNIAATHGWPAPIVKYSTVGNSTLHDHRVLPTTISYINEGDWDYVILQDHSRRTFSDTVQMWDDITWFYDTIKASSPKATVVLYETWATLEPYARNIQMYANWDNTLLEEWFGMQDRISLAYEKAANHITENAKYFDKKDTLIARVGEMWKAHLNSNVLFRLQGTNNHANDTGQYLNALSIYNTIYKTHVTGVGYWKVSESVAKHLQYIVDSTSIHGDLSSETDITQFSFTNQISSTINLNTHTLEVIMPFGSDITSLTPEISVSKGATIWPLSNIIQNFTSPVTYTVTSEDIENLQDWTVTVTLAADSTSTDIVIFSIPNQISSTVNTIDHTVSVKMPIGSDLTGLIPEITLSAGASIIPSTGTSRNFSTPVIFTVKALNGINQQEWLVEVIVEKDLEINSHEKQRTFTIFPNPVNDLFRISITNPNTELYSISIYEISGRLIYKSLPFSGFDIVVISAKEMKAGFYYVTCTNGTSVIDSEKLIIHK